MNRRNYILTIISVLLLFILSTVFNVQCTLVKELSHEIVKVIKNLGEPTEYSNTTRSGVIASNEVWSGEIYITGDIHIETNVTLTILPGTKVIFSAHSDDQHDGTDCVPDEWVALHHDPTCSLEYNQTHSGMEAFGTLIAEGTEDNMIIFTSDSPNPDGGDWTFIYLGIGSIIKYCIVEYSRAALDVAPWTEDTVLISNNIIRHNLWTGLTIHSSSPTVINNEIYDSGGHQGIAIVGENCTPIIENNIIRNNKVGIIVEPGVPREAPVIRGNTILNNDFGIHVFNNSSPIIEGNTISSPEGAGIDFTYKGEPIYFGWTRNVDEFPIIGINIEYSSPTITDNLITDCDNGINISGDSFPQINQNMISYVRQGIHFNTSFAGVPEIYENSFEENRYNIVMDCEVSVDVFNNWWGTIELQEIEDRIYHHYDDPSIGDVYYEPYLDRPVNIE